MDDGQSPKYEWFQTCSRFILKNAILFAFFLLKRLEERKDNKIT
jgi:hypothetical protein